MEVKLSKKECDWIISQIDEYKIPDYDDAIAQFPDDDYYKKKKAASLNKKAFLKNLKSKLAKPND